MVGRFISKNNYGIGDINPVSSCHVETVCLLVLRPPVTHINIDVDVDEMVQDNRGLATYGKTKDYVLEHQQTVYCSGKKGNSNYGDIQAFWDDIKRKKRQACRSVPTGLLLFIPYDFLYSFYIPSPRSPLHP